MPDIDRIQRLFNVEDNNEIFFFGFHKEDVEEFISIDISDLKEVFRKAQFDVPALAMDKELKLYKFQMPVSKTDRYFVMFDPQVNYATTLYRVFYSIKEAERFYESVLGL